MVKIIGIGEWAVSANKQDIIKTFALGSCVAMTVYCKSKQVAAMNHIALPTCNLTAKGTSAGKGYYASTAVPLLIDELRFKWGCLFGELSIEIFGGAISLREDDSFKIGLKNVAAVKSILNGLGLPFNADQTGGTVSRTVEIEVATGKISVTSQRMII